MEQPRDGVMARARRECARRLEAGESLGAVEAYIDRLPLSGDARAALWLWAWAWGERAGTGTRRRPRWPRAGSAA